MPIRTKTKLNIPGASFNIGDRAKCGITGFKGIVTGHSRHLTGCDTVWIKSETEIHEGRAVERGFDVLLVELVDSNPLGIVGMPDEVPSAG